MTIAQGTSRRQLLGGALTGLSGAALAGAGGDNKASQRTQPITIRFMSWRPNAMDRFEKKWAEWATPRKITISIDKIGGSNPSGDRNTLLTTQMAAGQGPDATDSHSDTEFARIDSGQILALDSLLSRDKINQDKGYALTYAEKWKGKTYQLAYWVEPFGIYYNKTMFQKKGIPDPWEKKDKPGEWTLDEMLDAARRATNPAADEWGLDWGRGPHEHAPLIWSQGGTHFNYDPLTWTLDSPASVTAHQWMADWWAKNKWNVNGPERTRMMAPYPGALDVPGGMTPFALGKVAVHFRSVNDWSRMFPVVKDQFQWDMLPIPTINGKVGASWTAGHPVNVIATTKYPDDVWDFMKFIIGDDFQKFMSEEQVLVPAKLDVQPRFYRAPSVQPHQHAKVFADVFKKPHGPSWRHPKAPDHNTIYNEFRDKLFSGELPVPNALKEANTRINNLMDLGQGDNPFKGLKLPIVPK
jgi:multiple sugar transport system substrate-binding protein